MKRRMTTSRVLPEWTIALIVAIPAVLGLPGVVAAQERFLGWHGDLNTAAKVSTKTGKPIFLVFRCVR